MTWEVDTLNHLMRADVLTDAGNFLFFREIFSYLDQIIIDFRDGLLNDTVKRLVSASCFGLLMLWVLIQGYRIVTGQSREPMMALVTNSLRAMLIVGVATSMTFGGERVYTLLTDGLSKTINTLINDSDKNLEASIDKNLGLMQVALTSIDYIKVMDGDSTLNESKTRAMWFVGIGAASPAVTGGALLLLNKIAMAMFIGFGPIFILCLLFDQTKGLFTKWLHLGIGTMFSLAVLSFMVGASMRMIAAVTASLWVGGALGLDTGNVNSMAMQQGGLGLVLTILIISAPPMAANFFQGMMGQFSSYNQMAGGHAPGDGRPAQHVSSTPASQSGTHDTKDALSVVTRPSFSISGSGSQPNHDLTKKPAENKGAAS